MSHHKLSHSSPHLTYLRLSAVAVVGWLVGWLVRACVRCMRCFGEQRASRSVVSHATVRLTTSFRPFVAGRTASFFSRIRVPLPRPTPHHTTLSFFLFRSTVVGMNARATSIGCLAGGRSWKGRAKGKVGRPVKCHSFMRAHENKQRLPPAWSAGHLRWRGGVGRLPATSTLSSLCLCRPPPQERTTLTQEAPKNGELRFASRGENDKE